VHHLVLLDAVSPEAVAEEEFPLQMRRALQDKPFLLTSANRVYSSVDDAVASRTDRGLTIAAARLLVERNLSVCPLGVTWTTDPRLRGASAVKLTEGQSRAVLRALNMPTLLMLARDTARVAPQILELAQRFIARLSVHTIDGGHHFHMESCVSAVALRIQHFLAEIEQREYA
jgi:pimeloyl-ACP methyl ester carboxylesterase